ncbi:MAG: PEP-utilizing enzyme [Hyphomicrobiaceae bacterium]
MQTLKEDAKHVVLADLAAIRKALLALDGRFGLDGGIFYLTIDEIAQLAETKLQVFGPVAQARARWRDTLLATPPLPRSLSLTVIERASRPGTVRSDPGDGRLSGVRVAGAGVARGRAYVVGEAAGEQGSDLAGFEDGDILVGSAIHPAWLGYVLKSGGVVSEVGGWLSHMAIVARERGIVMAVGWMAGSAYATAKSSPSTWTGASRWTASLRMLKPCVMRNSCPASKRARAKSDARVAASTASQRNQAPVSASKTREEGEGALRSAGPI